MKIHKTNATRLLDKEKINYALISYEVDENDLSATHVAEQLNEDVAFVYKTLVLRGDKTGIFICIIPSDKEIDLKKAAQYSKNKKANMVLMKELFDLTGYIRGGCSPIGMKKKYPIIIDKNCIEKDYIIISGGERGLPIKIDPKDLINYLNIQIEDII